MKTVHSNTSVDEGTRRRDAALDILAERRKRFILRGMRALVTVLLDVGSGTVDDIRALVKLPSDINPVCFGVVPRGLVRAGIIQANGFSATGRAAGHALPIRIWKLVDRAAAEQWLRDHPDQPDPVGDEPVGSQQLLFPTSQHGSE